MTRRVEDFFSECHGSESHGVGSGVFPFSPMSSGRPHPARPDPKGLTQPERLDPTLNTPACGSSESGGPCRSTENISLFFSCAFRYIYIAQGPVERGLRYASIYTMVLFFLRMIPAVVRKFEDGFHLFLLLCPKCSQAFRTMWYRYALLLESMWRSRYYCCI